MDRYPIADMTLDPNFGNILHISTVQCNLKIDSRAFVMNGNVPYESHSFSKWAPGCAKAEWE